MILALVGKAGSGKSAAADILSRRFDRVRQMAFAEPLKWFCKDVFDFSAAQLWGPSECRNAIDPRYGISPRQALQTLGTDWGRALYPNVWVELGMRRAVQHESAGYTVVITDARFKNEADAVRAAGGRVWRVVREGSRAGDTHASETEQDSIRADTEFENDGTLEDLENMLVLAYSQAVP